LMSQNASIKAQPHCISAEVALSRAASQRLRRL
jgi:hypothetical protein